MRGGKECAWTPELPGAVVGCVGGTCCCRRGIEKAAGSCVHLQRLADGQIHISTDEFEFIGEMIIIFRVVSVFSR